MSAHCCKVHLSQRSACWLMLAATQAQVYHRWSVVSNPTLTEFGQCRGFFGWHRGRLEGGTGGGRAVLQVGQPGKGVELGSSSYSGSMPPFPGCMAPIQLFCRRRSKQPHWVDCGLPWDKGTGHLWVGCSANRPVVCSCQIRMGCKCH